VPGANTAALEPALAAAGMVGTALARAYQTFNAAAPEFRAAADFGAAAEFGAAAQTDAGTEEG
jgi:hypothetical protein